MLTLSRQGINVASLPPPSADIPDNPKHRQLIYITLNDQILSQIQESHGKGLSITFGGNNAVLPHLIAALLSEASVSVISGIVCTDANQQGLKIGDKVHQFSGIIPESSSAPFEIYRQKTSSTSSKLDMIGRVTHKVQVRRGLDSSSMNRIKNRTEEAERERNSRKAVLLEKPPPSKRTGSVHVRHNSSNSRAFLSVFDNKSGVKGSGVRSLPSSPLLRPSSGNSTPKYLPIGGSPRIAPLSSPRLPASAPKPSTTPLRTRLIHILALGHCTESSLQEKTRALRTELSTCLQEVAKKIAPGSSSWELKDESYRELKPKEWRNYTTKEREMVEKKQNEILARLPLVEEKVVTEIPKKRTGSNASEDRERPLANTPRQVDSPAVRPSTPSIPTKRPAEEEIANPVRKVGGGMITKKKATNAKTASAKPAAKSVAEKPSSTSTKIGKTVTSKKESTKVKSAEKIVDSDSGSDLDIPLQKQVKSAKPISKPASTSNLKGLGISAMEERRPGQVISPPASQTYRSRTSSSSSAHSPPKKRSPLATNEPITARRSPVPPSPPPSAKKRPRDDEPKTDKRQKLNHPTPKEDDGNISKEHHDLAERFRRLYPEYQELHRRLQNLDSERLAKEKEKVDKLLKMQEQLEKWKAVLWKAAGETRSVGSEQNGTGRSNMVGVRV